MSITTAPPPRPPVKRADGIRRRTAAHPDRVGLGALILAGIAVIAIGAGWVTGAAAVVVAIIAIGIVMAFIVAALLADSETRRRMAPYGLLKPGILWLCLFFLAPLWSLLIMSLSEKETRFDFSPDFAWHFQNYRDAFTDFAPQFQRAFLYAAIATILTHPHRLSDRVRDRVPRRTVPGTCCWAWWWCRSSPLT